jgi:DNA polymerase elongation subunit (family B)
MIVESTSSRSVTIRFRDENLKRQSLVIKDKLPYCFVESSNAEYVKSFCEGVVKIEDGFTGVYGTELSKVHMKHSGVVSDIHADSLTWEGNIPFTNRVLIDRINEGEKPIPNYEHRVWYLDAEWSPTTNQMRMIVVYDSYTDKEFVWFIHPDYNKGKFTKVGNFSYDTPALCFDTEKEMLEHFVRHMRKHDPDVITGWYVTGADIKTIVERCSANNINPNHLSPMLSLRYKFGDWAQPIVGRNCIDLMLAFSKLWELKNGKLPSYKLGDVAEEVLSETKVELENGHDTYYSDLPLYLHYCVQDVRLLPKLDKKVNAINYYLGLQHLVQCEIKTTPFITKMFTCLALQDKEFNRQIPTLPAFTKEDYEGANVMDVQSGVHDNVGILDIKAMYHSNASQNNISWDSLDVNGVDCGNGTKFSLEKKGLLIRQMDNMTKLRNKYKELIKTDPKNFEKWDGMQFACKSLVASMYGVAGDAKYGLYHPKIAAAITYTSRRTLDDLKRHCEDGGFKVHYGHTDSVFVSIPTPQAGEELVARINATMHPIETEFEKWCSRMILMAKNRYAGNVTWTDGKFHEPKMYIKGIEMKQSRMPPIMKEVMGTTINNILIGTDEFNNTEKINTLIDDVLQEKIDPINLCFKGKLNTDLSKYKVLSGSSAGAAWANEYLGKNYRKGSFFLVTINESGNYIAFDNPSEINQIDKIGNKILLERFVLKKIQPYYNLMGWDVQPITNKINGIKNIWF